MIKRLPGIVPGAVFARPRRSGAFGADALPARGSGPNAAAQGFYPGRTADRSERQADETAGRGDGEYRPRRPSAAAPFQRSPLFCLPCLKRDEPHPLRHNCPPQGTMPLPPCGRTFSERSPAGFSFFRSGPPLFIPNRLPPVRPNRARGGLPANHLPA